MDFFSAVFSAGGESESSGSEENGEHDGASTSDLSDSNSGWSFGGLIKTLATKSESVIHNYRRDLEELGSGFKKETSAIREVAARAVRDLPNSLDAGASVAQESLESVGQAIDDIGTAVWKSTSKIISQSRETLLAADLDSRNHGEDDDSLVSKQSGNSSSRNYELKRYSRFDAQLLAIQRDVNTYLEEPEDSENYADWKLGFELEEKGAEIEDLIEENGEVREIYGKFVPSSIDGELFWSRYFYRVHKLKQAEEARVKLVKRAISTEEEEDLSWDFDDEDNEENNDLQEDGDRVEKVKTKERNLESGTHESTAEIGDKKMEGKVATDGRGDGGDSGKDSDISVISSQPLSSGELELEWDEIEDIATIEDARDSSSANRPRIDLHRRLSAEEEEKDLSWDTEDEEDEPVKS